MARLEELEQKPELWHIWKDLSKSPKLWHVRKDLNDAVVKCDGASVLRPFGTDKCVQSQWTGGRSSSRP